MSDPEAEALVRERFPWLAKHRLSVAVLEGYPDLRYVTIVDESERPLIGGPAYVVSPDAHEVVTVSASRPPRVNLEEAQVQILELGGGGAESRMEMAAKLVRGLFRRRGKGTLRS
jgi:hypothetical protein